MPVSFWRLNFVLIDSSSHGFSTLPELHRKAFAQDDIFCCNHLESRVRVEPRWGMPRAGHAGWGAGKSLGLIPETIRPSEHTAAASDWGLSPEPGLALAAGHLRLGHGVGEQGDRSVALGKRVLPGKS